MSEASTRNYRGDIDGLRAIAVFSVVLFHLNPTVVTGGYVGVDMFFVISGYLITRNIRNDLANRNFSFLIFYARRIRRLYPALFVTMIVTIILSIYFLFPGEMVDLTKSAIFTTFYLSNFFFYSHVDYFSHGDIHPLLHTWSLGVEEQFYLVFPILLVVLARLPRQLICAAISVLALMSLALAEILVSKDSSAAFFWSVTRFWEFAAGALITFLRPPRGSPAVATLQASAGLGLILCSVTLISARSQMPGLVAIWPVLGTVLFLRSGEGPNPISRAIDIGPLRFLGKISYSLYLIHWPLIAFARLTFMESLPLAMEAALLLTSIALATLMYFAVERPAYRLVLPARWRLIFGMGMASTAVIAIAGAATLSAKGFPDRYPAEARRIAAYLDYDPRTAFRAGSCLLNTEAEREGDGFDEARCIARRHPHDPQVLLIGDSYAAQYHEPLRRAFPGLQIAQVTATGCRPLLNSRGADPCVELMSRAFNRFIQPERFAAIIIAARWSQEDLSYLPKTLAFLKRQTRKVYLLGPMVEYSRPLPRLIALSEIRDDEMATVKTSRQLNRARRLDGRMSEIARRAGEGVRFVSVLNQLCDAASCVTITPSGAPTHFDHGHLTVEGASLILDRLKQAGRLRVLRAAAD